MRSTLLGAWSPATPCGRHSGSSGLVQVGEIHTLGVSGSGGSPSKRCKEGVRVLRAEAVNPAVPFGRQRIAFPKAFRLGKESLHMAVLSMKSLLEAGVHF